MELVFAAGAGSWVRAESFFDPGVVGVTVSFFALAGSPRLTESVVISWSSAFVLDSLLRLSESMALSVVSDLVLIVVPGVTGTSGSLGIAPFGLFWEDERVVDAL
jgi:hypothetical protein